MSFFARLAQILKSNLNELISRSEDPEKMLEQVIRDMADQLTEATKQVAVAIADEKRLEKAYNNEAAITADWEKKAMLAVRAGRDDLAREALARKKEHDGLAAAYQDQWQKQAAAVKQLKTALRALNQKIEEAKRKKSILIARKRRAEAMKSIQETMSGMTTSNHFETCSWMYVTASLTVRIFSVSSSGMSISNCSSNARTSSTMARESAPRSSMNEASSLMFALSTSSCWEMISLTFSAMSIGSSGETPRGRRTRF